MNSFYTDNFNISKINACVLVEKGAGQKIHKNRPFHGLVLELTGTKRYIFDNGRTMDVYPNDVFYLPKFSNYEVVSIKDGDCIAVNFELANQSITYPFFSIKSIGKNNKKDFENILLNWNLKKDGNMNLCFLHLYSIIANIQKEVSKHYIPSKQKIMVNTANEYIAQNIGDYTLTVEKIANHLKITPEYFRRIFGEVYGRSPRKYIIDLRMEKAKGLLSLNEFTIAEISQMCGYDSESYFSSEFKRIVGCPPTKYNRFEVLPHGS